MLSLKEPLLLVMAEADNTNPPSSGTVMSEGSRTPSQADTPSPLPAHELSPNEAPNDGKPAPKKRRTRRFSLLRFLVLLVLGLALLGLGLATYGYREFAKDLPRDLSAFHLYRPPRASRVFSADGELVAEFFVQKRIVVPFERIPKHVIHAFVAAEDARFFKHMGVDPIGIVRAAIRNFRAGRVVQGASTITQQVARMILLSPERTTQRKIREVILAHRIERELSKERILGIYLNHVYLGHGAYGVQAAAEVYFGKDVEDLSIAEAAMLAGLPKAPTADSPYARFERARARQAYVLERMVEDGYITAEEARRAREEPVAIIQRELSRSHVAAPYFAEHVRKHLVRKFGVEELFATGVDVFTTLDMRAQRAAEAAVLHGLEELDRKLPFRGPIGHLDKEDWSAFLAVRRPYAGQERLSREEIIEGIRVVPASRPAPQGDTEIVGRLEDVDLEVPYLGLVTSVSKGVEVRIGDLMLKLTPGDAERALRWKEPLPPPGAGASSQPAESPGAAARTPKGLPRGRPQALRRLAPGDVVAVRVVEQLLPGFRRETVTLPPANPKRKPRTVTRRRPILTARYSAALAQRPQVQAALVALDPFTGHVKAMVGGTDYQQRQFNRAVQARRQIGSAIKPFIYGTAMEQGLTELSVFVDAPVAFRTASGVWSPKNYDGEYHGAMTLKLALAKSINTIAAQLVARLGVGRVIDFMRRVGITSAIPRHISIALGTPDLSLLEVACAQAAFANGGLRVSPVFVLKVVDRDGRVLEDNTKVRPQERAITREVAYLVTDLMKGVVQYGTGKKAQELGRPVAGKTGTSTGFRDAWFVGFTTEWLAGVWVGRDDFKPIAHNVTGGQFALPIWLKFMSVAHPATPPKDFEPPDGVYFVRAMPDTGQLVPPGTPGSVLVPLRRGTLPEAAKNAKRGPRPEPVTFEDTEF